MDQHDAFEWFLWGQIGCVGLVVLAIGIAIGFGIAKVIGR